MDSQISSSLVEFADIASNKALVAATVASLIGQASKPFTLALRGRGFDPRAAFLSGGMPSTHSAAVVAAATALGLEKGLSDSIFGMAVVFAALVMYDAQGVRREVGNHAKFLNQTLNIQEDLTVYSKEEPGASSMPPEKVAPALKLLEKSNSYESDAEPFSTKRSVVTSNKVRSASRLTINGELPEKAYNSYTLLNESVGHTEIQVLVGALLGFFVSLAIDITS